LADGDEAGDDEDHHQHWERRQGPTLDDRVRRHRSPRCAAWRPRGKPPTV